MVVKCAIVVRDARKRYGGGSPILDGLNLTVAKGSIYGLLGASGCGKTTLLSCIVGVRQLDSGEVWVLGGRPGSKGSGIPGPRVGYMPQDISLVEEFSVLDALYYFGRINGMEDWEVEERYIFLKGLLQLPPKSRLVKNMSGGQQRRVSFAAALLHKPELLILDEPTVGLDPVLRDNIWNHLVQLAQEGVTVIITTHYIEEARQADRIGLLRCGQLLAESSPKEILERFQTDSLEEAFLALSQLQAESQGHGITEASTNFRSGLTDITLEATAGYASMENKRNRNTQSCSAKKLKALLVKNITQFVRHPGGILFAMVLPIIQVMIFFNVIGNDPRGLKISVVNEEAGHCDYGRYWGNVSYDETEFACNFVDLSCRFLSGFNDSVAKKVYYSDFAEAREAMSKDGTVGVMHFKKNFSLSLQTKLENFLSVNEEDIIAGQIEVSLDMGDRQINLHIQKKLYENFFEVYENVMRECQVSPKYADVPIRFEDPIFGTKDQKYTSFVAPTFILTLIFFLATSVCSSIIIADRYAGVWDRSLVQGVTTAEILVTHLLTQLTVIAIQVTLALCLSFLHFDLECKGSMAAVIWLVLLEGICGMSYGFLISVMCTSHTVANYISTGSFYPMILLCGVIWPVEGMPKLLRWFSFTLPLTIPGISMRDILDKGYSLNEPEVYSGFLIVSVWITGFISLCLFNLKSSIA